MGHYGVPFMTNKIKDYKIVKEIGSGGIGKVYKAIHPALKIEVIIKKLIVQEKDIENRFMREAQIMMSLRHDNIVPVYDYFVEDDEKYIVMEYVDGVTLGDAIGEKSKLDPRAAIFIFNEIAKGLYYAHSKGVVHRDMKPLNVLISKNGDVKIIDFGIASYIEDREEKSGSSITKTGIIIGTPAYMSPEHFSDMREVTHQSDIYSMGIILYEMMLGECPFSNEFNTEVITARLKERYIDAKKKDSGIPSVINNIIRKCLKSNPVKRYKNINIPGKGLERYFKDLTQKEINKNIAGYVFKNKFDLTIEKVHPIYTSFISSFRESRKRLLALLLIIILITGAILAISLTNIYYHIFHRGSVGRMEIEYYLPIPYYGKLPDKVLRFGDYKRRIGQIERHLRKFINDKYRNKLFRFQLRAHLIQRKSQTGEVIRVTEIILTPENYIKLDDDGYRIDFSEKQELSRYLILSSPILYYPKNHYSLKIIFNGQLNWTHFTLDSINKQIKTLVVKLSHSESQSGQVDFKFKFYDDVTNNEINDMKIFVSCRRYRGWTEWNSFINNIKLKEILKNDREYRIKFVHPDYKIWLSPWIYVGKDQSMVNINMRFKPIKKKRNL